MVTEEREKAGSEGDKRRKRRGEEKAKDKMIGKERRRQGDSLKEDSEGVENRMEVDDEFSSIQGRAGKGRAG